MVLQALIVFAGMADFASFLHTQKNKREKKKQKSCSFYIQIEHFFLRRFDFVTGTEAKSAVDFIIRDYRFQYHMTNLFKGKFQPRFISEKLC